MLTLRADDGLILNLLRRFWNLLYEEWHYLDIAQQRIDAAVDVIDDTAAVVHQYYMGRKPGGCADLLAFYDSRIPALREAESTLRKYRDNQRVGHLVPAHIRKLRRLEELTEAIR